MAFGKEVLLMELAHLRTEDCVCRTMWIGIWNGHNPVVHGISESIAHSCQLVMMPDNFQSEMYVFSKLSFSLILVVKIHTVGLPEMPHEFFCIRSLDYLMSVCCHKCLNQAGGSGLM